MREKKIIGGQFLVYLRPFWKLRIMLTPPRVSNFSRISIFIFALYSRKGRFFLCVTFFSSYYYETANFFMNSLLSFTNPLWHFLVRKYVYCLVNYKRGCKIKTIFMYICMNMPFRVNKNYRRRIFFSWPYQVHIMPNTVVSSK